MSKRDKIAKIKQYIKNLVVQELNKEDLFLEYATCLRMSELGYMSKAQDNLHIAYNDINEYLKDLKNALTKEHKRYGNSAGLISDATF